MTEETKTTTGRWLIKGTLTTKTPLHIGNGDTITRHGELVRRKKNPATGKMEDKDIEINAVVTDFEGKAYIPGSTLKGNLRSWLKAAGADLKLLEQIFGSDNINKDAVGGKAEIHDALITIKLSFDDDNNNKPPYWFAKRQTGVSASVTIDRQTGTAREGRLFYQEFVPPGVSFGVVISGQDMTDVEVGYLLSAFEKGCGNAPAPFPLSIGSATADGYGMFDWKLEDVKELESNGIKKWLNNEMIEAGDDIIAKYGASRKDSIKVPALSGETGYLTIGIELTFDGPFLVNDPSRVSDGKKGKPKTPDHVPRVDKDGNPILPVSSFRGAFRAQAEKIIRTVGGYACRVDDIDKACKPVADAAKKDKLCLACQLFGGPGWKSAVEISPFTLQSPVRKDFVQDFIAVDRFTGGAKDGAKFDALSVLNPVFSSVIRVDMKKVENWGLGLLALTLRDLKEGDITFGFGAAKGYGACRADVTWPEGQNHKDAVKEFIAVVGKGGKNNE